MATKKTAPKAEGGSFVNEVEKTANAIIEDVKQLLESLTGKVSNIASSAADATASVAEKVSGEPTELLKGILQDVKEVGESAIKSIGERFDGLKESILKSPPPAPVKKAKKKRAKKATAKKKAVSKKKASKKPVATSKKKVQAKQATAKKKSSSKKKASVKKKAVGKQRVVAKKA